MTQPLTIPCPECARHGRLWRGERGPGDPSGRYIRCDATGCEDGVVTVACGGCEAPATEMIDGEAYCAEHAQEWRADNAWNGVGS